jgi:RNA polymerase sigma-70 factor (ECF subfamily)
MLAVAMRTLGSAAEAEDIVQDVWLRWQNVDRDGVRNAPAFLTTTTIRLAINRATVARTRHGTPLDFGLAELVDPQAGPGVLAERAQALEGALRLLLEKLSPLERAVYLLREAFNYGYPQIVRVVGVSEASSRQLMTRARKHLADGRRVSVGTTRLRRLAAAFLGATEQGDLAALEAVLAADIVATRLPRKPSRVGVPARDRAAAGVRDLSRVSGLFAGAVLERAQVCRHTPVRNLHADSPRSRAAQPALVRKAG